MLANRRKQTSSNLSQSTTLFLWAGVEVGGLTDQLWLLGYRLLHKQGDSYGIETLNVDLTLEFIFHNTPWR